MMNKKWDSDVTTKFLELYEQCPCLWDVHLQEYKNVNKRNDAYAQIADAMNMEGFSFSDVKAKIRSIRNSYAGEKAKISRSKKSGAGLDEIYKPKLAWFPTADRILNNVVQIRQTNSTALSSSDNRGDVQETENFFPSKNSNPPKRAQKVDPTAKAIEELKTITMGLNNPPEQNEFEIFGVSVGCQLKKLPGRMAQHTMAIIQNLLVKQRLKSMEEGEAASSSFQTTTMSSDSDFDTIICQDDDIEIEYII